MTIGMETLLWFLIQGCVMFMFLNFELLVMLLTSTQFVYEAFLLVGVPFPSQFLPLPLKF